MFQRNICYIIIISFIFMASCRKDKTLMLLAPINIGCVQADSVLVAVKDTVYNIPQPPSPLGWQLTIKREFQYSGPCFNPRNPEEFVYIRQDMNAHSYGSDLRILNLCTGQDRLISNNAYLAGTPCWSNTGWIVYTGYDNQLYKVTDQGIGLTKLTTSGMNQFPVWNPEGNKILYQENYNGAVILIDSAGNVIKNLPKLIGAPYTSWTWTDKLAIVTGGNLPYGLGYYDFNLDTIVEIKQVSIGSSDSLRLGSIVWLNDNRNFLYSGALQISITDTFSGQPIIIRQGGDNAHYGMMNISPDQRKIIIERVDIASFDTLNPVDYFEIQEYNIYIFNVDGSGLRKVKFPQ